MDTYKLAGVLLTAGICLFLVVRFGRLSDNWIIVLGVLILLLAAFAVSLWQLPGRDIVTAILLAVFGNLFFLSLFGVASREDSPVAAKTKFSEVIAGGDRTTLFVLVHGLEGDVNATWGELRPDLLAHGDVLQLDYDAPMISNADPEILAGAMADKLRSIVDRQVASAERSYASIVLVGHSVGALLVRKLYLIASQRHDAWTLRETRIVLLAGMNRGWDVTGKKPMDMSSGRRLSYWVGSWFARLSNSGRLVLSAETGSPFVANLRLDWMRYFREADIARPIVVQLLGDIDDRVSSADNQDLRAAGGSRFYWLRVRGTGHSDIVSTKDTSGVVAGDRSVQTYAGIGAYRQRKILLAATGTESEIRAENEELAAETNEDVRHIVFILHGIRDLGEWSAQFERELRNAEPATKDGRSELAVVSVRYGFFSMASFLLRADREKYVRWFMDQYTETIARYPKARRIDFIGHSNGTYLLASALQQYRSLEVNRIVFAGSVVRKDYDWASLLALVPKDEARRQVQAVRNYIAPDDAVVALFPRFFEPVPTYKLFRNNVGSAGFAGFDHPRGVAFQQATIYGGHSAFLNVVPEIAQFVSAAELLPEPPMTRAIKSRNDGWLIRVLDLLSRWLFFVVPLSLLAIVIFPGIRVAISAGHQAWVPTILYAVLVLAILKRV